MKAPIVVAADNSFEKIEGSKIKWRRGYPLPTASVAGKNLNEDSATTVSEIQRTGACFQGGLRMPEALAKNAYLTSAEFSDALGHLSALDGKRLLKVARAYALGTGLDGDDLFQETVTRGLLEERQWPHGVSLVTFLSNAMRSIAHSKRKEARGERGKNEAATYANGPPAHARLSPVESVCVQVEDTEYHKKLVGDLITLFDGDEQAQWVLIGDLEGCSASAICEENRIDRVALATIRRRIRRKIEKTYPKGWRP